MRWMGWDYAALCSAPDDYVDRIAEMIVEDAERRQQQ